jgi:putative monooxygenase
MQQQQTQLTDAVVIRANQRRRRPISNGGIVYEELTPAAVESLVSFMVTAEPGQATAPDLRHGGDESLVVLAGRVEVDVEGTTHTLNPGDSIFIPRGRRHRLTTIGTETAHAVFVLGPPRY